MKTSFDLERAHQHAKKNKDELSRSKICGCFYCLRIYQPGDITEWWDENESTAVCPHCGIDAVIGDDSKLPITKDVLKQMRQYWFAESE